MEKPHLDVSAAIIFNDARDKILITHRNPGGLHGDLWEFPGGKIEPDESPEECLLREIQEELGITLSHITPYVTASHEYEPFSITLHTFSCLIAEGIPRPLECQEIRWIRIEELPSHPFPEADKAIVACLLEDFTPNTRKFPVTDTLDLHTFQPKEVKALLQDYLETCHRQGLKHVRIIHGKGTGTLKRIVHSFLKQSPLVKSYSLAPETDGGWGATVVELGGRLKAEG